MTDDRNIITNDELERQLVDLSQHVAYPPTPAIAAAVRERLSQRRIPIRVRERSRAAIAAAVLVLVLVSALALAPGARTTIAGRLGLRGVEIITTPTITVPPDLGHVLTIGSETTLADAREKLGFQPVLPPTALGEPNGVFLLDPPPGGQLSYVYLPRAGLPEINSTSVGLLISQFAGTTDESLIGKLLEPGTTLEVVRVGNATGFWIAGEQHVFLYKNPNGSVRQDTIRLAANVLIWEVDGITARIESNLTRDEVVKIAASMTR